MNVCCILIFFHRLLFQKWFERPLPSPWCPCSSSSPPSSSATLDTSVLSAPSSPSSPGYSSYCQVNGARNHGAHATQTRHSFYFTLFVERRRAAGFSRHSLFPDFFPNYAAGSRCRCKAPWETSLSMQLSENQWMEGLQRALAI